MAMNICMVPGMIIYVFGFLYIGLRKQDGGNCRRRRVAMKLGCGM